MKQDDVKTSAYWYHYYLFKDIEFQTEAYLLRDILIDNYPGLPGYDEGWLKLADAKPEDLEVARDIAARYQTSAEQVYRYISGFYDDHPLNPPLAAGKTKGGHIMMEFDASVTQEQYIDHWPMVKALKKDVGINPDSRTRGAEDYSLIYAIHKARRKEQKFSHIHKLYEAGDLPGYSGSSNQFKTSKSLEAHYNKYKFN
jgi:hypothetical protein